VQRSDPDASTKYHEAGHAVVAVVLRLSIGGHGVSINSDKENDTLGTAHVLCRLRENPECAVGAGTQRRLEQQAIMRFAGDAAERKASSRRRFDGHQDQQCAANMLAFISTSGEQHDTRIEVARIGARDLVEGQLVIYQGHAEELFRKRTLKAAGRESDCPALR
jgi:hypothetical protein